MQTPVKSLILLLIFIAIVSLVRAQEFGGNPPSIKWKQIIRLRLKLSFPIGLDSSALRVANIVEQMNRPYSQPSALSKNKSASCYKIKPRFLMLMLPGAFQE